MSDDDFTTDVTFDAPGGWPYVDLVPGDPGPGWTPPATIGGTWCRMSPEGIFETWPRDKTRCEVVLSDGIKALLGTTATTGRA